MTNKKYAELQYYVNNLHMDGRQEHQFEEAIYHAATFSKWLKHHELPVDSILDAGCRTGYAMEALGGRFPSARVVGVDIAPQFIEVAALRGEAVVGDLQELPFKDKEFDWTFSCTSIEHCPNLSKAISEMQRVSGYGFYIQTDLEDDATSAKNPSHFANHENPGEWVSEFSHPDWWLVYLNVPRHHRIEMIWIRKQHKLLLKEKPLELGGVNYG